MPFSSIEVVPLAVVVPLVEAEIEGGFELVVVLGTDVVVSEVVTGVAVDVVGLDDVAKVFSASSRFYESVSAIFYEQNSIKVNCS
jgi:ATP phosphoribosyltransferase